MDIDMDYPQVHGLDVVETGRRRRWSAERKRAIVEESLAPGVSASSVARRHGISPTHLFLWRKAYRDGGQSAAAEFVPVMFEASAPPADRPGGRMEIVAGNGRRVIVGADVDPAAVVRLLLALEQA